ncbi:hypothetical protein RCH21_001876 [Arthrobacter sp. PL16]|uniref:hypothetical protein n=1 Tax=Arthrobacter sp. PL16 TaxID=3071720 RepID=UPI002E0CBA86|nr:hypothetical protein [Arthrobacter sp. PL16]
MSVLPLSVLAVQAPVSASATTGTTAAVLVDLDVFTGGTEHDSLIPSDLSSVSTRELRVLCTELYRALDEDFPPYGAREHYAAVVSRLEERELWAHRQPEPHHDR